MCLKRLINAALSSESFPLLRLMDVSVPSLRSASTNSLILHVA